MIKQGEKNLNETNEKKKISNLPDKEFKVIVIKMLTQLKRRIDECNENFNKEIEKYEKATELKNTILTQKNRKNTLEGFKNRQDEAEERISRLEDRAEGIIQSQKQRNKKNEEK